MKINQKGQRDVLTRNLFTSAFLIQCVALASPALANGLHPHNAQARGNHGAGNLHRVNAAGVNQATHFGLGLSSLPISKQHLVNRHSLQQVRFNNVPSVDLNLNSELDSIVLSQDMIRRGDSVTINLNGTSIQFNVGDKVSAGELVAIRQTQSNRGQTIELDATGRAVGGTFSLDKIASGRHGLSVNDMVIPQNVNATDLISKRTEVNLSGDLVNYGSITEISRGGRVAASISAQNISNQETGLISTVGGNGSVDLTLQANNVTNLGTIESSGDIRINSPLTNNSGRIASANGNITLDTATVQNMTVNNTNGILSAINGDISIRDTAYSGAANAQVIGGNLLSRNLNLNSGAGAIDVDVLDLTGTVTSSGNAVHVKSSTDTLTLGKQCLTGDPTYFNGAGNIAINGNIVVAERLAIMASGDIITAAGVTNIKAQSGPGQGFDITIVAGANVTGTGSTTAIATTPPVAGNATGTVQFSGASATGGNVDFSASGALVIQSNSTLAGKNGGSITLAAFNKAGANGKVLMPVTATINAGAVSAGLEGNVTVIAPGQISLGSIRNGANDGALDIMIAGSQPKVSSGANIVFATDGSITSGNFIATSTNASPADVTVFNLDSTRTSISTGGNISLNGDITAPGGIALLAGHNITSAIATVDITTNTVGDAGPITIAAGALFTYIANFKADISGSSVTGGQIDFTTTALGSLTANSTVAGVAGTINIVAYKGSDDTGTIKIAPTVQAKGSTGQDNGVIRIVSGQTSTATAGIKIGSVDTSGGQPETGIIILQTGPPGIPTVDLLNTTGVVSGSFAATSLNATDVNANVLTSDLVIVLTDRNIVISKIDIRNGALADAGDAVITSSGTVALDIGKVTTNSIGSILASGGATSGGAGTVTITDNGNFGINIGINSIDQSLVSGDGGQLDLDAGTGAIQLPTASLSMNAAGGNFNGGFIRLTASDVLYPGAGVSPLVLSSNGSGTGNGGTVILSLSKSGPITIGATGIVGFAKGGTSAGSSGGAFILDAPNADLTVDGSSIDVHTGGTDGDSGNINLRAATVVGAGSGPLVLDASGTGIGDGGSIQVESGGSLTVGTAAGELQLTATAGAKGGNGGSATVLAGTDLTVNPAAINVSAVLAGDGGSIVLTAGEGGSGNLLVNGSLNVNGVGGGDGGTVALSSQSTTAMVLGGKKVTNGVTGTVTAIGNQLGLFTAFNSNGDLTLGADVTQADNFTFFTDKAGSINVNKALGSAATVSVTLNATGTGNITAKKTITSNKVILIASGGLVGGKKAIKVLSGDVISLADGQVNIADSSTTPVNLTSSVSINSSFKFTSAGDINIGSGGVSAKTSVDIETTAKNGSIHLLEDVTGGTVTTLVANGTGKIDTTGFVITSPTVNLSTKSGAIGPGLFPIEINADNISAVTTGDVQLESVGTKDIHLIGASSNGFFALESNGNLFADVSLKNANIIGFSTANNGNIVINASQGGKNTNAIILLADGTGDITQSSAKLKLTSADIDMSSILGDMGSSSVRMVTIAPNVSFFTTGTGSVHANSTAKGIVTLDSSSAGSGGFDLLSGKGGLTIGNLFSDSILITSTGGLMKVADNAILNAISGITLNNTSTKGVIELGQNSSMATTGTVGTGEIDIVVGPLPPPTVPGTTPANVDAKVFGTGAIFFNNGITANGAKSNLKATDTNLVFSAPTAGQIILDGNVTIDADPPAPVLTLTNTATIADGKDRGGVRISSPTIIDSVTQSHAASSIAPQQSQESIAIPNFGSLLERSPIAFLTTQTAVHGPLINSSTGILEGIVATDWINETELASGQIPASIVGEMSSNNNGPHGVVASEDVLVKLDRGSILSASKKDRIISTRFGDVSIAANSMVVVMSFKNGVAVYNLHDEKRSAVRIATSGKELSIAPGRCVVIASDSARSFDEINPAQLIAYRGILERSHGDGLKSFHAQFSLPTAMNAIVPLKELMKSKHPHAIGMTNRLLKTTSILMQLHGSGADFRQFVKPAVAAYVPN